MIKRITIAVFAMTAAGAHAQHTNDVNHRGDQGMGFSHEKTTHHFRLAETGGSIDVEANDVNDTQSRDRIREHLRHVASQFSAGNFELPMFIHDRVPPGVPVMKKLKAEITYTFTSTERGGKVTIASRNPRAVEAVHEFLKFQIKDHQTGDSL